MISTTFIYTLTDPTTGLVRYVGKSDVPKKRIQSHIREARVRVDRRDYKNNWIRSLLNENKLPVLEIIDEVPKSEWSQWELHWYFQLKQWGFDLTNDSKYLGIGSTELTEIQKQKIVNKNTGRKFTESHKTNLSIACKKKELTDNTIERFCKFWKGKKQSKEHIDNRCKKGVIHSDEAKLKISIARKGKKLSQEHKDKISAGMKKLNLTNV